MRSIKSTSFSVCILLLLLSGCGQQEGESGPTGLDAGANEPLALEGSAWQLVKIVAIGGYEFAPAEGSRYNLRFRSENRLVGESDCNRIGATWVQDGHNLTFEQFATTNDMCLAGTLHNHFVSNLMNVRSFSSQGDTLTFTTNIEGVTLEFAPLVAQGSL